MPAANGDLFKEINNAVLDLQQAHVQSYDRPLKTLARLLHHPDLKASNERLTANLDLDAFLAAARTTEGSMVGSARLHWPDDEIQRLGLTFLLIERFAEKPAYLADFGHTFLYSGPKVLAGVQAVTSQVIIPFVRDYKSYVM